MTSKTSPSHIEENTESKLEKTQIDSNVTEVEHEGRSSGWWQILKTWGVESRGICPVPVAERTDSQYSKTCFIWLSYTLSIIAFSLGTIGPIVNKLSFKTSAAVIVGFGVPAAIPAAYLSTFGPKLGLRQMVQPRYSFGYYGAIVPGLLQLLNITGYSVINVVLGGKILSAVSGGSLNWNVGIVVVSAAALVISFFGYRVVNLYVRIAWIPMLVVFLAVLGVGAKRLPSPSYKSDTPETHISILRFGLTISGYMISFAPNMSNFTNYMCPEVNSWRIFILSYIGLVLPGVSVAIVGAAFGASLPFNPSWQAGYDAAGPGGLVAAVLDSIGGFGKFLTVLLGLSVIANLGPNFYSLCFSFQVVILPFNRIPRYVFSVLGAIVVVPLAIVGAKRFEATLTIFLGMVGYWCSAFVSILIVEHIYFRRSSFSTYDISSWDNPRALPPGLAALGSCILAIGVVVLFMSQSWYVGVAARKTGDIGLEVGLLLAGAFYIPLRTLEKRVYGR